jgi:outer membrane protein assembly factor BamE (lipoprotein component of BamABCDE complex)
MRTSLALLALALASGCKSTEEKDDAPERQLTTGVVQKEIRKGMSGAQVAESLGSPNIVTTDEEGREVWVYERYARDVKTKENGYFVIFLFGSSSEAKGSTRTLTVIVKFDHDKKVRDFAYHASTF